ncbi:MAG: ribulose-phosphate 3-epimerase [Turicibacter sp.]|nr:ribulose-phosphate 3-epimerase [Turicibacter sp.]
MYKLAPSILSADFTALGGALIAVEKAGAHYIHFDVMDGHYVPNITFGPPILKSIRRASKLVFDVHLMITNPIKYIETFVKAGADIITVHLETMKNEEELTNCIAKIREHKALPGIALNPHTKLDAVFPFVSQVEMILVMSVEPGFGGQSLLPFTLGKAEKLAKFITNEGLKTDIEMDGGIDLLNLRRVLDAGVNVVVAGTSVFGATDINFGVKRFLETFASYDIRTKRKGTNLKV